MTQLKARSPVAVDLFAGAGGLTLGARRAGFTVSTAVEIDKDAVDTYKANHPTVTVLQTDIRRLSGKELLSTLPERKIDLLMGCAPCQGFCSLTAKRRKPDPRNELILDFARIIAECQPTAVFMENVPGLLTKGKRLFRTFVNLLSDAGYSSTWDVVQMADYGIPQSRKRLVFIASKGAEPTLPNRTHSNAPEGAFLPWKTLHDAIYGEQFPQRLSAARKTGGPEKNDWHIVRDLQAETAARLKAAFPGKKRTDIDASLLPDCHQAGYEGFSNVYTRMSWTSPSPTITAGCTTPAKGRFGHPDRRRTTISVREAAVIQTFPRNYKFTTSKIDTACQMIGNAVPPDFARTICAHIHNSLLAKGEIRHV